MRIPTLEQFKLCFVTGDTAFFTSGSLADAWGDDWDSAPYEMNAEPPYAPLGKPSTSRLASPDSDWNPDGSPKWQILEVKFSIGNTGLCLPHEGRGGSNCWSVRQVNAGEVPWFQTWSNSQDDPSLATSLNAGASYEEFCRFISAHGGLVWRPLEGPEAAIRPTSEA